MSRTQKQIGLVGLVFFAVASLVVPWKSPDGESAGYSLIFAPPARVVDYNAPIEQDSPLLALAANPAAAGSDQTMRRTKPATEYHYDARIDLLRLFLVMGFVMVATIAAVLLTKDAPHVPEAAS